MKTQRNILITALIVSLFFHYLYGIEEAKQCELMQSEIDSLSVKLKDKQEQIELLEIILEQQEVVEVQDKEYLGQFKITHYCSCEQCCGKTDGITFTGTQATEERTVAVDPDVIPLGSKILIDEKEYIAEDVGGAIKENRLDIYMNNHSDALKAGIKQADVWLIE